MLLYNIDAQIHVDTFCHYFIRCEGNHIFLVILLTVSVGYEYQGCSTIVWAKRPITIEGHQWSTAALGGWQLPIQHSYNYNKGRLKIPLAN